MTATAAERQKDRVHPVKGPGVMRRVWLLGACILAMVAIAPTIGADDGHIGDYPSVFRFGVLNILAGVNPKDAQVAIEMNIVKRNEKRFPGISAKLEILKDVASAKALFGHKRLHAIALTGADYIALNDLVPVKPLFVSSRQNDPLEAYVLLALNSVENLEQLFSLTRRRLVREDYGTTNIGQLWLETVLRERGFQDSRSFFTAIQRADKPARMVLPVFFGQAEACLVPESAFETMAELNPQISQRLRVLLRSPGFVRTVTCASNDLNPRLVEALKRNAIDMPLSVDGQQLMMIFQYKRQFLFDPAYLRETERIYRRFHENGEKS